MKLIDEIYMACNQGRPVELRDGRKAYVVGNAENFFHQLNCKKVRCASISDTLRVMRFLTQL